MKYIVVSLFLSYLHSYAFRELNSSGREKIHRGYFEDRKKKEAYMDMKHKAQLVLSVVNILLLKVSLLTFF